MHRRRTKHGIDHADRHEALAFPVLRPEFPGTDGRLQPLLRERRQFGRALLAQHDELGEAPHAALVGFVRERSGVGGGLRIRENGRAALHQRRNIEVGVRAVEGAPHAEAVRRFLAAGKAGVHDEQARIARRRLHRQREAKDAAPVLHDEADILEVHPLDKGEKGVPMELIGVNIIVDRLVGPPKAEHVDRDSPVAGAREDRDHLAEKIGPARLAMDAEESDLRIARAFVDIMHPQAVIAFEVLDIMRGVGPAGQVLEPLIGGSHGFDGHGGSPLACLAGMMTAAPGGRPSRIAVASDPLDSGPKRAICLMIAGARSD